MVATASPVTVGSILMLAEVVGQPGDEAAAQHSGPMTPSLRPKLRLQPWLREVDTRPDIKLTTSASMRVKVPDGYAR